MFDKAVIHIVMLLALSLLSACDSVNVEDDTGRIFFENAQMLQVESVELGYYSNYTLDQKYKAIRSESEFKSLWNNLHGSRDPLPEIPPIDFNEQMVVVSTMGTRSSGGYKTEITKAAISDNQLGIKIENTSPGEGCGVTDALTNPYHIASIDKVDFPVIYFVEEITRKCTE